MVDHRHCITANTTTLRSGIWIIPKKVWYPYCLAATCNFFGFGSEVDASITTKSKRNVRDVFPIRSYNVALFKPGKADERVFMRIRKSALNLAQAWDRTLLWYARAIDVMKSRPIIDPTS